MPSKAKQPAKRRNLSHITPDLRKLAQPVADFTPDPRNANLGSVEAVARSFDRFGQRKPIVARLDGTLEAGEHMLLAARKLGWEHIAAVRIDEDDATATAYGLADNRSAELGDGYDEPLLAELLQELHAEDEALLAATSWDESDIDDLLARMAELDAGGASGPDQSPGEFDPIGDLETDHECPKCGYQWS